MLYNRHNLAVAGVASDSSIKPVLSGVMFTKDKTVATDSYRLVEISVHKDARVDEFPKVQGISAMQGIKPFIVWAKGLKEIKIPKSSLPMLENVAIKHVDDQGIEFITTDLETVDIKRVKRINETFPDYEKIFPVGEPLAEVEVNAEYLAEVVKILGKLDSMSRVKIKLYGTLKPLVFEAGNDKQRGRGLLMPMNK